MHCVSRCFASTGRPPSQAALLCTSATVVCWLLLQANGGLLGCCRTAAAAAAGDGMTHVACAQYSIKVCWAVLLCIWAQHACRGKSREREQ